MIKKHKMLINNEWVEGKKYFPVYNPFNGELLAECPFAEPEDVDAAIDSAKKAFNILSQLPSYKRSLILEKTSQIIEAKKEEIAGIIVKESGKAWKYAYAEAGRAVQTFKFAAEEAKQICGETIPMDASQAGEKRTAFYKPFPIGVVAAITPFNFPLNLVAHKVAPAIAAGNTVVLKPASTTPLTAIKLGEIMLEAGMPEGCMNIITGSGKLVGDKLTTHPDIALISFTGSPPVGSHIKKQCGIKKVVLELGSNSALIVEQDADLEKVIPRSVTGAFANSGQVCISIQRIYVHSDIFKQFQKKFIDATNNLNTGNPMETDTEYGPLIEKKETDRVMSWIKEASEKGAKILTGGKKDGEIILPTVLTDVTNHMKVCSDEVFGPVVSLFSYNKFENAIDMVNNSVFGLQAGVYTNDINKAFLAYSKLHVGGVIINDIPTYRVDNMPYGGVKMSGSGREGLKFAISEMMELKLMVLNCD